VSEASLCALDQDKFFEYRHALFENFGANNNTQALLDVASTVEGLDPNQISECLASDKYQPLIQAANQAARAWNVNATPTFFINGQRIEGNEPYPRLRQIIEQKLAEAE
jgi:protein-disulfide isomerase